MERVSTGIETLDELMEGGIPKGFIVEVSGPAGSGKTIFCMQFLVKAAKKGKRCLYLSFDQPEDAILSQAKQLWPDIDGLKSNLKIIRYYYPEAYVSKKGEERLKAKIRASLEALPKAFETLDNEIESFKPDLVVVDSISALTDLIAPESSRIREIVAEMIESLRTKKITTLVTSELPEDEKKLSRDGVSEFIVDGVLVLYYLGLGTHDTRTISIRKMRQTNHGKDVYPLEITKDGVTVKKSEEAYKV